MASYKLKCNNYEIKELPFNYQNINYGILEKDLLLIVNNINQKNINTKQKINMIKEQFNHRLNKQYHNLTILNRISLDKINTFKNKINKNINSWNKYKLLTNNYEMVYNSKYLNVSIAVKKPLSRSYFKMIEIGNKYLTNIINETENIKTLHLAEGPGGFIEALVDLRGNKTHNDLYYGISLETDKNIPGWNKSTQFLKKNPQVNIVTGINGTGNILDINNIKYLFQRCKNMDLITADGGFNFSKNYYIQEYNAAVLIFAEFICAVGCLKKGGTYVFKLYDINYKITADILFLIQNYFENFDFFKPNTSRIGNSEKYVICNNFIGINNNELNLLLITMNRWINIITNNEKVIDYLIRNKLFYEKNDYNIHNIKIIDNIKTILPDTFKNLIVDINNKFNDKQIENIKKTLNIDNYNPIWLNRQKEIQLNYAYKWCIENNVKYSKN